MDDSCFRGNQDGCRDRLLSGRPPGTRARPVLWPRSRARIGLSLSSSTPFTLIHPMKGAVLRNHTVTLLFAFCSFVAPGCSSKARPDPTSTTAQALAQAAPLADGLDCLSPQSG